MIKKIVQTFNKCGGLVPELRRPEVVGPGVVEVGGVEPARVQQERAERAGVAVAVVYDKET